MRRQVCSPRIVGRLFVSFALVLLSSTFVFAHNSQASDLADNPAVAAQLQSGKDKPTQLDGELEIVHQDFPDGHGRFVFTLKQADGTRMPLQFMKHPPTHLLTGDHVTVRGQRSGSGSPENSGLPPFKDIHPLLSPIRRIS